MDFQYLSQALQNLTSYSNIPFAALEQSIQSTLNAMAGLEKSRRSLMIV